MRQLISPILPIEKLEIIYSQEIKKKKDVIIPVWSWIF